MRNLLTFIGEFLAVPASLSWAILPYCLHMRRGIEPCCLSSFTYPSLAAGAVVPRL